MVIFEARRQVDAHIIMGFTGAAWSHRFMIGVWKMKHITVVKAFKKSGISNALHTENDVLFEVSNSQTVLW